MFALGVVTLVVCAPGYPGSRAEAQPTMDALARALSRASGQEIQAVYEEAEAKGLERLSRKDAALLLSPLPFWFTHRTKLKLDAKLTAVPQGGAPLEQWTLVAGKGHPASLEGYAALSTAGYAPQFVHAVAPALPGDAKVEQTANVLTSLRRAANGEKVAVLLDGTQTAALEKLPFASSLEVVERSPPMPVAIVATVGKRIDERRWKTLQPAFQQLANNPAAAEALEGVRMSAFV